MTPDERKVALSSLSKLCPDPAAIHRCKWFKFQIGHTRSASIEPQNSHTDPPLPSKKDLERLRGIFTDKEILSLSAKSATLVHDDAIRDGFQQGRRQWQKTQPNTAPYTVTCLKSGKCSCKCAFYSRNNICCHTVTVAWKTGTLSRVLETYMGRNMNSISISTVSSSVGKKKSAAGFKRKNIAEDVETRQNGNDYTGIGNSSSALSVRSVNPATLVIRKPVRLEDRPPAAPLLIKKITANIRKCLGCAKPLSTRVERFWSDDDVY